MSLEQKYVIGMQSFFQEKQNTVSTGTVPYNGTGTQLVPGTGLFRTRYRTMYWYLGTVRIRFLS